MGLVVQLPVDPVVATLAVATGDSKQANGDPGAGDSFAALLAAFASPAGAANDLATADAGAPAAPADPAPKDGLSDPTSNDDALAASFAAWLLPIPVVAQPLALLLTAPDAVVPAATEAAAPVAAETATPTSVAALRDDLPLTDAAALQPPASAEAPAPALPSAGMAPLELDSVAAPAIDIVTADSPPVVAEAAAVLPLSGDTSTAPPPARAAGEPPGAVTPNIEISVVRSVGNATEAQPKFTGSGNDDEPPTNGKSAPGAPAVALAAAAVPAFEAPVASQAAAPAAAPASPPAVEQVVRAAIEKIEQGGGEVHLHLDPPELGRVSIHVRIDGDRVQVNIQAERGEAMNLLRQHTIDLSSLLGGRGLNLTDVNVGLGGRNAPGAQRTDDGRDADGEDGQFAELLGIDPAPSVERHNRLQATYNPDGRHLYRV